MKKKILIVLGVIIALIASFFMLYNFKNNIQSLMASAKAPQTATASDTTQKVNFYGADNETILYTANVPYGQTLNQVKSKNLLPINTFSGTLRYEQYLSIPLKAGTYKLSGKVVSSDTDSYVCLIDFMNILGNSIKPIWIPRDTQTFYIFTLEEDCYSINFYASNGYGSSVGDTFTYTDIMITTDVSDSLFEPYFDDLNEYVNEEYLKSANISDLSTPISWSTSSASDNRFNFGVPITKDYDLYGFVNDGITTDYEGELTSRMSDIGNYALSDIVSMNINGFYVGRATFNGSSGISIDLGSTIAMDNTINTEFKEFYINSDSTYFDLNIYVTPKNGIDSNNYFKIYYDDVFNWYSVRCNNADNVEFYIYFSNYQFGINAENQFKITDSVGINLNWQGYGFSKPVNYYITNGVSDLVDMNSNTNFTFDYLYKQYSESNGYYQYNIYANIFNNRSFSYQVVQNMIYSNTYDFWKNLSWSPVSSSNIENNNFKFVYHNSTSVSTGYYNLDAKKIYIDNFYLTSPYDYYLNYNFSDYYFIVDKPSFRVNNALLLYNFDYYQTLNSVNKVVYELSKGGNYYDIIYNGTIPNYKYLYINNEEIDNTIFDRYIYLHLYFNDNYVNVLDYLNGYSVGFDFNFAYYVEPLISDVSTYEYEFNEPDYVDATPSLVPFYIPWTAVAYNLIVFLAFKCPKIKDIIAGIGFNYFLGSLLQVVAFIINNPLGDFIMGCLAFLILFAVLRWLFPLTWSVGKSAVGGFVNEVNNTQDVIDNYYKKLDENNRRKFITRKDGKIIRRFNKTKLNRSSYSKIRHLNSRSKNYNKNAYHSNRKYTKK